MSLTAATAGVGPPCLPPKASSSSWWQSILPGGPLEEPPCAFPPPARVGLHGLPELSRPLGPRKPAVQPKLVLGKSPLADLDTALGGPSDDDHLAATLEGLMLPLPCPLTVGVGPPGERLGCTRAQD